MSAPVFLTTMVLMVASIVAVFGLRAFSAARIARLRQQDADAYRALAEQAALGQTENTAPLIGIQSGLAELKGRLAKMEAILQAVE
jgi:hypothetical protein